MTIACKADFLAAFEIHHAQRMAVAMADNDRLIKEVREAGLDLRTVLAGTSRFHKKRIWVPKIFDPSLVRKVALLMFLPLLALGQPAPPTINVVVTVVQTNATPTNAVTALPPHPSILPLSMQMRMAAQLARGKASPWLQRFMVSAVEEKRADESTNYLVTVVPITDETNAPVSWGTTKNNSIRFYTIVPTKKGDEFELFPVKMPMLPQP